jgi:hypothetical protein
MWPRRLGCLEFGDAFQNQVLKVIEGCRIEVGNPGLFKVFEKLGQILDGLACGSTNHELDSVDAGRNSKEVEAFEN